MKDSINFLVILTWLGIAIIMVAYYFWIRISIKVIYSKFFTNTLIFFKDLFKPKIIKIKAKVILIKEELIAVPLFSGEYGNLNDESVSIPRHSIIFKDEDNKKYCISISPSSL